MLNAALAFAAWKVWSARAHAEDSASASAPLEIAPSIELASAPGAVAPAVLAIAPLSSDTARDAALERKLRAIVLDAERKASSETKGKVAPERVRIGVHVRALDGRDLAAIDADRAQRPASNLKLVTTSAALVLLGSEARFDTPITSSAPLVDGALHGDLVVHAGADPLLDLEARGDVSAFFAPAIAALRAAGVRSVGGDLVLDEGTFAEPAPGPAWPDPGQHWAEFCALAGGFSANAGCLTATVTPGAPGSRARVVVRPLHHGLEQRFDVTTTAKGPLDVRVEAKHGYVKVAGTIPKSAGEWSVRFAAPDPVELFGNALAGALREAGIPVRGVRRERMAPDPDARVLARIATPIVDVLQPINAHSNNACADQLFLKLARAISGRGTREKGETATKLALERLGIPTAGFAQVDGSGLSRDDRASARQVTALLASVARLDARTSTAFFDSLAAPDEDGTLERRMKRLEGRVRAKTGFIGGTSALSGVVDRVDGTRIAFSILVEYPVFDGLNRSVWKPMQDAMVRAIAGEDG